MSKFPGYKKMELPKLQQMQLDVMKVVHKVCVRNDIKYYIIAGTLLGAVRHKGFIPWDDDIDIAMMREDFEKFKEVFPREFDQSKLFLQYYDTDPYFQPALMRICIKDTIMDLPSEYHLKHCKNSYMDIFPLDNVPNDPELQIKHSKKISHIDRIMNLRYYHVYNRDNSFRKAIKKFVSILVSIIPVNYLRRKRNVVMQQYNSEQTKCVCSTVSHYKYSKQVMPREYYGTPTLIQFEDAEFYAPEMTHKNLEHLYGKNYMSLPPVEKRDVPTDVYIKLK